MWWVAHDSLVCNSTVTQSWTQSCGRDGFTDGEPDRGLFSTNQMSTGPVVLTTLFGKHVLARKKIRHLTSEFKRLPAKDLATTRDQRQTLNRWNKFVLGEDYTKETAKRFPKTKE